MDVVVTTEHRFLGTPDGAVWTQTAYPQSFWDRYLMVFDGVQVVARIRPVPAPPTGWQRSDRDRVQFVALPYYVGPWAYLRKALALRSTVKEALDGVDAVILRVPSQIASIAYGFLEASGRPYGVEVVGDPWDMFSAGSIRSLGRPFFRTLFVRGLKEQCGHAAAAAYVTDRALQMRYPPSSNAYVTHFSSIELPASAFRERPRNYATAPKPARLIYVGSLEQLYKAPDVLIEAVSICSAIGADLRLTIVGEGRYRRMLERKAAELRIADRVRFVGALPAGPPVRDALDRADLFVLPSRQEGLPRAMIEAMARGLPCLGSTAGGIPELLPAEDMVPPGDTHCLASKILELVSNPGRLTTMSARNLDVARKFRDDVLLPRRREFYMAVRHITEQWLASRPIAK